MDIKWVGNHIEADPPRRPKKITGTRLAAIFGLNKWNTPFKTWCEITKVYSEPFQDTKYTIAGKVIEPKQAEFMRQVYAMNNLKTPTDIWGEGYFQRMQGDFFHGDPILGGMWDYILQDENGKPLTVLEMKTTKRSEDWANDIPEYYAFQASLYAYLLGVDDVIMVCSILRDHDYEAPEEFQPSIDNTLVIGFKVSERYPDFMNTIRSARRWWQEHVETGISPDYDEQLDADILKNLRTYQMPQSGDLSSLMAEYAALCEELAVYDEKQSRLNQIKTAIRNAAKDKFPDGADRVQLNGAGYTFTVSKSESRTIHQDLMEQDGILDKYSELVPSFRMTVNRNK